MDGAQNVAVYQNGSLKYWNILANGVVGRYEPGSGAKFFYLKDHLGSTRAVVNASGTVVEAHDYYPFGLKMPGRIYPTTPTITKNLFTGKELDGETGWYDLGARPYIPALGRMPVVDPLWDKYPSLSPYSYAANNPVVVYDPDGRYLETLIDLVSLGVSIYDVAQDPGSASNWIGLGLDVVSVLAPGATALGAIYKAGDKGLEAAKALDKASDATKNVPNPFGKKGGTEHQETVEKIFEDIKSRELEPVKELKIETPGGEKSKRFVDVAGRDPKTREIVELHQVGEQTKTGIPVKRERTAIEDIEKATGKKVEFHPKKKKEE